MTNLEKIRNLPLEELAKLLVEKNYTYETYDWDENLTDDVTDVYISMDDNSYYDFLDAVEANIEWLKEEYNEQIFG